MTRIRITTLALAAVLALAACSAAPATTAEPDATTRDAIGAVPFDGSHVAVDDWAEAAAGKGVVILDVRTPEAYAGGHISGAINVDLNSGSFESEVAALDPEASYAVYCRSGNRSSQAIDIMATLGITKTIGLEGGIGAWTAAGYSLSALVSPVNEPEVK